LMQTTYQIWCTRVFEIAWVRKSEEFRVSGTISGQCMVYPHFGTLEPRTSPDEEEVG
jgi:hypothetical protein